MNVIFFGGILNLFVKSENRGLMPVFVDSKYYSPYLDSDSHFYYTEKEQVKLYELTDIFSFKKGYYGYFFSIGDVLYFGGAILLFLLMFTELIYLPIRRKLKGGIHQNEERRKERRTKT